MNNKKRIPGRVQLYAPFVLALFVFIAILGGEYLIVRSLIQQDYNANIEKYHKKMCYILENIDEYNINENNPIHNNEGTFFNLITLPEGGSIYIQIIPDSTYYADYLLSGAANRLKVDIQSFDNVIVQTSVGTTDNDEIVILELYEQTNWGYKNFEKLAYSILISLLVMIIFAIVPGVILIESLQRKNSMLTSLSPVSATASLDILHGGIWESKRIACFITSPSGSLISVNPFCNQILELGKTQSGLLLGSITCLPLEIRKMNLFDLHDSISRNITLVSLTGSENQCLMEVHPHLSDGKIISFMFLIIPYSHDGNSSMPASSIILDTFDKVNTIARAQIISTLIHDMNNHISGIIGMTALRIENLESSDDERTLLSILNSSEKLAVLCDELGKTIGGGHRSQIKNISQEIGLIAEVLKKILPDNVAVEVTGNCPVKVKSHRDDLQELFYGLALNSTAIMNGQGRIRIDISDIAPKLNNSISATTPGSKVCIRYSDGFIMPVALRDIFSNRNYSFIDVERQYGSTVSSGYKALSKIKGSIVFERGSGETIMCILLDVMKGSPEITTLVQDRVYTPSESELSVLVADDIEIVLKSVSENLRNNGMLVTEAVNGDQVMELLRSQKFDIAVLDLNMPGAPTPEIVKYCQNSIPNMVVIITSGFEFPKGISDLIASNYTEYLHKPHKPEVLIKMIHFLIKTMKEGS